MATAVNAATKLVTTTRPATMRVSTGLGAAVPTLGLCTTSDVGKPMSDTYPSPPRAGAVAVGLNQPGVIRRHMAQQDRGADSAKNGCSLIPLRDDTARPSKPNVLGGWLVWGLTKWEGLAARGIAPKLRSLPCFNSGRGARLPPPPPPPPQKAHTFNAAAQMHRRPVHPQAPNGAQERQISAPPPPPPLRSS